ELREVPQRLGEDRLGAGIDQGLHPVDGGRQAGGGAQVGAGHHQEVLVATGISGGPDPPGGGVQVDYRLAVQVAAAFGVDLVLDVAAGQPRLLELLDRAGHVHRLAETGVGVDQTGQIGGTGDLTAAGGDLGQGGQADVGQTQLIGDHGPGDVHTGEA